jgi:hypothetical protein
MERVQFCRERLMSGDPLPWAIQMCAFALWSARRERLVCLKTNSLCASTRPKNLEEIRQRKSLYPWMSYGTYALAHRSASSVADHDSIEAIASNLCNGGKEALTGPDQLGFWVGTGRCRGNHGSSAAQPTAATTGQWNSGITPRVKIDSLIKWPNWPILPCHS